MWEQNYMTAAVVYPILRKANDRLKPSSGDDVVMPGQGYFRTVSTGTKYTFL